MTATTPLTCDGFADALADYLERDDSPRARAAVETHAASCAQCGALLADLQQLRVDASGLPTLTPSRDLWAGVADRIATPVLELGARGAARHAPETGIAAGRRSMPAWIRPAAAAAGLVIATAGVTYYATREALLPEGQVAVQQVDSTEMDPRQAVSEEWEAAQRAAGLDTRVASSAANEAASTRAPRSADRAPAVGRGAPALPRRAPSPESRASLTSSQGEVQQTLEAVYGREIVQLRRIVDQRRAQLDTATVGVIERNLTIIDQAIRESRAALARDPASAYLNEQLNNVLERKVELLRAAALLPVRS